MGGWLRVGLRSLGVLWGLITVLFVLFELLGDPARLIAGERADAKTLAAIRTSLGLDEPFMRRYVRYFIGLSPVSVESNETQLFYAVQLWTLDDNKAIVLKLPDVGQSFVYKQPVTGLILDRFPATALLALTSLFFAVMIGVMLGVFAAVHPKWEAFLTTIAVIGVSAPSFLVGIGLVWFFSIVLHDYTGLLATGYVWEPSVYEADYRWQGRNLVLPTLTLAIRPLGVIFQLTKAGMQTALLADYTRTATAKGLKLFGVWYRHALPNAMNPVLTAVSGWLAALLAGAFFVEHIFDWPGIGKLTVEALFTGDYPLVLGISVFIGSLFIALQMLVDWLQKKIDPTIG